MRTLKNGRRISGFKKFMLKEEFELVKGYLNTKKSPSLKMCIKLMSVLGIRVGDAVKLRREHFSDDFSILNFEMQKTKKPIIHFLPEWLSKDLRDYYEKYNHRMIDDFLFFANFMNQSTNKHITRSTVAHFFVDMRRAVPQLSHTYGKCKDGKPLFRITPHTLRHYASTVYYEGTNHNLIAAQDFLGHADIRTTQLYVQAFTRINQKKETMENTWPEF